MAWRIENRNELRQTRNTPPRVYQSMRLAFDAAWDEAGVFLKAQARSGSPGDRDGPPAEGYRMKVLVDFRPGELGLELRYDYPVPGGVHETNSIWWNLVDV